MSDAITEFSAATDGLAAELGLLEEVSVSGDRRMMIWSSAARALALPERFSRSAKFESAASEMEADGWPVITRRTGGGITPQGPGVVNVAIGFSVPPKAAKSVPASYASICDPLVEAFSEFDIAAKPGAVQGSFCDGDFNLEVNGRKIVGTAQRWRGAAVLCHALILIDVNLVEAVRAAQMLSDGLELGDRYNVAAHTQLKDLRTDLDDLPKRFAAAAHAAFAKQGFKLR